LVIVLYKADSFFYLILLTQNIEQLPRKFPMNMTQKCHFVGRDSYRVRLEYKPHGLLLEPNGLVMLETHALCIPTWTSICERSRSMA